MPESITVTEVVNQVIISDPYVVTGGGGGGGVTDHGALTGLADDDHTQYLIGNVGTSTTRNSITMGVGGRGLNIDAVDSVDTHIRLTLNGVQFATWNNESGIVIEPGGGGIQADSLSVLASNAGRATVNIPHGTAPTMPVNGDIWTTTSGVFARVNGSTVGPLGTSGSGALDIPALTNETDIAFADSTVVYDASAVANREVAVRDILTNPRRRVILEEEFMRGNLGGGPWPHFTLFGGGSAAQAFKIGGVSGIENTSVTIGGFGTSAANIYTQQCPIWFDALVSFFNTASDATNNFTVWSGVSNSVIASPSDFIGFRYNHGTFGGRIQAVCRASGVETAADTGISTAANTYYWLSWEINAAGTSVSFYVNGTLTNTLTTNIPGSSRNLMWSPLTLERTAGTASRTALIDYTRLMFEFGTLR